MLVTVPVQAQDGTVTGVVVDARTQQPIADVQVRVSGGTGRTATDAAGRFHLNNLPGARVNLLFAAVGYRPSQTAIDVGRDVRVELSGAAVALDEVIVTGTAGEVERRAIGNTVAKLDVQRYLDAGWTPDVTNLINGRVPGVVVIPGSGQLGAGPTIRIRGAKSFSLNTNPMVYVDGLRVNHETGLGIGRVQAGSGVISRLNDLGPEQIESIEIIKGPAAATLYGTEASNGVIQIVTRRGRASPRPEFAVTVRQGATWFMNPEGRIAPNWSDSTGDTTSINLFASEQALGRDIFTTGYLSGYTLSLQGGSEMVRYFAAADLDRDRGIEPTNYQNRLGARASLAVTPNDKVDVTANFGFSRGHTQLACEGPCPFGVWWSTVFADPDPPKTSADSARRGFLVAPPEVVWDSYDTFQKLSHSQVGLQIRHQPAAWLSHRLTVGGDRTQEADQEILHPTNSLAVFYTPAQADGHKSVTRRDVSLATVDYSATLSLPLSRLMAGLTSATTLGAQYYRKLTTSLTAFGDQFALPGLETISATAITTGSETIAENNTLGFFIQQQLGFRNRLFLTGALRADDNSAFGKDFDVVYYPKLSASWVAHEEAWWPVRQVDVFRIRLAYGASGQQPQDFAALQSYAPVTDGSGQPALTPQSIGNDNLAPERGEEFEIGFEAALLNHRVGLEFTYYAARTLDAILRRDLPPSLGFPGEQFVNAGEIRNHGVELQLRTQPVRSRNLTMDLNLNLGSNSNQVVDLGGVDQGQGFIQVPGALARQRHVPGRPAGAWFSRIVVSAEVDPVTGEARNVLCDGGTGPRLPDGTPTQPGGSPVACAGAPDLYVGRPFPSLEGALEGRVTLFGRLQLYGIADFKRGHRKLDNTLRDRCLGRMCREHFFPQEYDPRFIAEMRMMQTGQTIHTWIMRDASFARLRELSASYAFPDSWARRIGARRVTITVAGRNLHTWAAHAWLDPEAEFVEGGPGDPGERESFNRQQLAQSPQLAQFMTTINLTF